MLRKIVIAILCLAGHVAIAQNSTISPYSFFGVGDLRNQGTIEAQMMGGLGMYADSIHVNLQNPAGYGKLRLTTYTFGGAHREFRLATNAEEQSTSVTALEYLVIALPLSQKVGVAIGAKPFSSVGYDLVEQSVDENGDNVTNAFSGTGGVNQVFLSIGATLAKNFQLGASSRFNFGTLENERLQSVENIQLGTLDRRESQIKGFDFNFGLLYAPFINGRNQLFTSVRVNTQANLNSTNTQRIGSFSTSSGDEVEVVEVDLEAQGLKRTFLKIPTTYTVGLGYGRDKQWFIGAEYSYQGLDSFENVFLGAEGVEYTQSSVYALGAYWIPDYASFTGYLKRINYRAGVRYEQSGLIVDGKEINNIGITFGFGLPLGNAFSNFNVGFEVGRRGTKASGLIEESYFKLGIGISLNDRWFQKRKVN